MALPVYFLPPQEHRLAPNPTLFLLRGNTVSFDSTELNGEDVKYIVADRRCKEVSFVLRRGLNGTFDTFEVCCAPDNLSSMAPLLEGQNWWTSVNSWVLSSFPLPRPLSFLLLAEEHISPEDMAIKFSSYVQLLNPDVTIVCEGYRRSNFHALLMSHYDDFKLLELRDGSDIQLLFYFKSNKVTVQGLSQSSMSFIDVKVANPVPSSPAFGFPPYPYVNGFR